PGKRSRPLREMFKLRYFRILGLISSVFWFGVVLLPSVRVVPIIYGKTAVPLHYNIHVGVDMVGPWWQIYLVPTIGLLVLGVNLVLARFMWTRDPMLSHVAVAATAVIELLLFVAMIFIVFLSLSYA
ncbi:MAG: hypothetical protein QG626_41, partial [Patescibacteria group bacterium]|nr:hypothetical protein [Patescibacteria group bacterium]